MFVQFSKYSPAGEYSYDDHIFVMHSVSLTEKQRTQLEKLSRKGTSIFTRRDRVLKKLKVVGAASYQLRLLKNAVEISNSLTDTSKDTRRAQRALYHANDEDLMMYGCKFGTWFATKNPAAYTVVDRYVEDTAELADQIEKNLSPEMRRRVGDEMLRLALIAHNKIEMIMKHDACTLQEADTCEVERDFAYEEERRLNDALALEALDATKAISAY